MTIVHGFELVEERRIDEIGFDAKLWRHTRTGAELMSLSGDDENKVFGVSFRTPPEDSTGVAHILEHSVLCGSAKYPVKEPFVELLKGSLQTFLNAFTYPDKTCYPVASANLQDFYNLMDVYLDAVFHPVISEDIFRQEGWHYELEGHDGPLTRKGVVFNEMKGVYSSPDSQLYEHAQHSLYPDNAYGIDSGGDPNVIPQLTYEQFKNFHETYYHPSNARFWFSGDDPEEERLRRVAEVIDEYDRLEVASQVALQPRFDAPRSFTFPFAGGENAKGMFITSWLLPETVDREQALALEILDHILIGLPSSPLRRALMESGLGEDLCGGGLENELRQQAFLVGLKGMDPVDLQKAESIMMDVLKEMAEQEPPKEMMEAAVNSVEFDLRENNTGRFPRGLSLMLHSLTTWLYDADPFGPLAFAESLEAVKSRIAAGEPVFSSLIREYFIDNPHRVTVLLTPEEGIAEQREAEEKEKLAGILDSMDEDARRNVMQIASKLHELQEKPDAPEDIDKLPALELKDIPREETPLPGRETDTALFHDVPAQGVVYLDAGFDLAPVPERLLPLVPVFGRALLETGTSTEDFASLSMRIARKTGGISPETFTSQTLIGDAPVARLFLRGKCTGDKAQDMLDILKDVLMDADLGNRERIRQIVLEEKARHEQRLIPTGHLVIVSRMRARSGPAGWAAECMDGVVALFALRELADRIDVDWESVKADLLELKHLIVRNNGLLLNATGDGTDLSAIEGRLNAFRETLPSTALEAATWTPGDLPLHEGLSVPAQVNYVGRILQLAPSDYSFSGAHLAAVKFARMGYLWDRIRVQGGAYGAFCMLDRFAGTMAFASYRDPNVAKTAAIYDAAPAFFKQLELRKDELEKSIIGAIGEMDAYLLPDAKGYTEMVRRLVGDTAQKRQAMREELLATTNADFQRFGEMLVPLVAKAQTVVLGGEQALEDSGLGLSITKLL